MPKIIETKKQVTLTVVVTGNSASLEIQQYPSQSVLRTVMPRMRTGTFTDDTSATQTCQHLADGINELSKEYQVIMPGLYQQSLIKRGLIAAHIVEDMTVHGYESVRIDGSVGGVSLEPKVLKKSDKCRALMTEHIHSNAEDVIALIATECELTPGLAKKYYLNNLGKVQVPLS